jgi:hypothetical protein
MLSNAFPTLLLQICVQWTKLAIYSKVTAGSNIVHLIKNEGHYRKEKAQLTSKMLKQKNFIFWENIYKKTYKQII